MIEQKICRKLKLSGKLNVSYSENDKTYTINYQPPVVEPFQESGYLYEVVRNLRHYIEDIEDDVRDEVMMLRDAEFIKTDYKVSDFYQKLTTALNTGTFAITENVDEMKQKKDKFICDYIANNKTGLFLTENDLMMFNKIIDKNVEISIKKNKEQKRLEYVEYAKKHLCDMISHDDVQYEEKLQRLAEAYADIEIDSNGD